MTPADQRHADAAAFCAAEWPQLVRALSLYVGDAHLAEELVQEALLRACRRWTTVSSLESPGGWTWRVATNLANSHFRRRRAGLRAQQRIGRDDPTHRDPDGGDAVAVRQAVAALPERQRTAVVLRHVLDLSAADAAADPTHTPDFDALAARGRRQHLAARAATTAVAAVALVAGGVALWPGGQPAGGPVVGDQPTTASSGDATPTETSLPPGWHELRVGGAVLGVPGDWAVETVTTKAHVCSNEAEGPTAFVLHAGEEGGRCLAVAQRALTVQVAPLSTIPSTFLAPEDGRTWRDVTTADGIAGQRLARNEHGTLVAYRFPSLDLWLQFGSGDVLGDEPAPILATIAPSAPTGGAAPPTPEELRAPYEPAFTGLPAPRGDGPLVATDSRVEGLGAFLAPGQPLPLDQPNAVQDAPVDATFTVLVRDADTGTVVAEVAPDTPAGASFEGPTTGPVGTRYVLEATLRVGDRTTSWTDVAVVTDPTVRVEMAFVAAPQPGAPVEFVLVNRGTAGVVHGLGHRLDELVDGTWVEVEDPAVKAIGLLLPLATVSEVLETGPLPGPGHYRLTTQVSFDEPGHDAPAGSHEVSREFIAHAPTGDG